MKKFLFSMVVAGMILPSLAFVSAATVCGDPALSDANTTYVSCGGNGSPEMAIGGWGTNNSGVPHMSVGQTVTDEGGITSTCPPIASFSGCVDTTHTAWYRTQMLELGRQLKALGQSAGMFGYWINHAI